MGGFFKYRKSAFVVWIGDLEPKGDLSRQSYEGVLRVELLGLMTTEILTLYKKIWVSMRIHYYKIGLLT